MRAPTRGSPSRCADWLEVYGEIVNIFNRNNFHPSVSLGAGNFPAEYEVAQTLPRLPTYGVRVKF